MVFPSGFTRICPKRSVNIRSMYNIKRIITTINIAIINCKCIVLRNTLNFLIIFLNYLLLLKKKLFTEKMKILKYKKLN